MKHNELSQTDVPPTDLHGFLYTNRAQWQKQTVCDEYDECKLQTPLCAGGVLEHVRSALYVAWVTAVFVSVKLNTKHTHTFSRRPHDNYTHSLRLSFMQFYISGAHLRVQRKQNFYKEKPQHRYYSHRRPQQRICECALLCICRRGFAHLSQQLERSYSNVYTFDCYCWGPPHNACNMREYDGRQLFLASIPPEHNTNKS